MSRLEHPIWDVHDLRRTARLRHKYYCARLVTLQRQNFWTEIVLAATTSGSAIAGLAFWGSDAGKAVWQVLIVVSAVIAVAKPLLQLGKTMQGLETLIAGYALVEHDLQKIDIAARQRNAYDTELQGRFNAVLERMDGIVAKQSEYREYKKLKQHCEAAVNSELPAERFFVPES